MIISRYTQIVFQPHVKMPHLHCCDAALSSHQQHSSLFVVFDWPIQRRTDWVISFLRTPQRTIVLIPERKRPLHGDKNKQRS